MHLPSSSSFHPGDARVVQHMQINKCKTSHINRTKDKNHIIISINAVKAFDKIQHLFMIKALNKLGIKGSDFKIRKAIYDTANIILNGENKSIFFKIRTNRGCSFSLLLFNIAEKVLARAVRQGRDIKCIPIRKQGITLSLFAENILYLNKPEDSIKRLLEMTNKFRKVAEYKINIQISSFSVHQQLPEKEMKTTTFPTATKQNKTEHQNLWNKFTKVKDVYSEN